MLLTVIADSQLPNADFVLPCALLFKSEIGNRQCFTHPATLPTGPPLLLSEPVVSRRAKQLTSTPNRRLSTKSDLSVTGRTTNLVQSVLRKAPRARLLRHQS